MHRSTSSGIRMICLALAAFACSRSANAQTFTLDNVPPISLTSSSTISAFSIDHVTGNVLVRSSIGTYNQCTQSGSTPTIGSFFPTASTVTVGSTITLNWISSNTTSCSPSQGSATTWPSLGSLPTSGSRSFAAPATAGTITFQLNCTNGVQTTSATTEVVVQSVLPPPTVQLTAPGSVGVCLTGLPKPFAVSWTSTNAVYCRASEFLDVTTWGVITCIGADCPDPGDPFKLRALQPQRSLVVRGGVAPGTVTTLQLTCFGADGQSASDSRTLTLQPDPCATSPSYTPSTAVGAPAPMPDGSFQLQSSVANPQGVPLTASILQQGQYGDAAVEMVGNTVVVRYLPRNGGDIRATIVNETIQVVIVGDGVAVPVTYNFQVDLSLFSNGFEGGGGSTVALQENFDGLAGNPTCPAGWSCVNLSSPLGATSWLVGDPLALPVSGGAAPPFIAANFENAASFGTISNWLISPQVNFAPGQSLRFWTRAPTGSNFPDRLEIRASTASASPGGSATSVGDFTILLGTVNPNLLAGAGTCATPASAPGNGPYPQTWCEYRLTSAQGLPTSGSGRIAFRYAVTNAGPGGSNGDYIGIDTVRLEAP